MDDGERVAMCIGLCSVVFVTYLCVRGLCSCVLAGIGIRSPLPWCHSSEAKVNQSSSTIQGGLAGVFSSKQHRDDFGVGSRSPNSFVEWTKQSPRVQP